MSTAIVLGLELIHKLTQIEDVRKVASELLSGIRGEKSESQVMSGLKKLESSIFANNAAIDKELHDKFDHDKEK